MNELFGEKDHLFVVHVGEIHPVHLHNLVSNLHFGRRTNAFHSRWGGESQTCTQMFWSF